MTPEARAVDSIRKALEARGCKVLKIHGNEYMPAGTPDLIVAVPAYREGPIKTWKHPAMAVIEVKAPGGSHPTSKLQERELRKWAEAGALAGVCRTAKEALQLCGLE